MQKVTKRCLYYLKMAGPVVYGYLIEAAALLRMLVSPESDTERISSGLGIPERWPLGPEWWLWKYWNDPSVDIAGGFLIDQYSFHAGRNLGYNKKRANVFFLLAVMVSDQVFTIRFTIRKEETAASKAADAIWATM